MELSLKGSCDWLLAAFAELKKYYSGGFTTLGTARAAPPKLLSMLTLLAYLQFSRLYRVISALQRGQV
jgi:hypothetical protein